LTGHALWPIATFTYAVRQDRPEFASRPLNGCCGWIRPTLNPGRLRL